MHHIPNGDTWTVAEIKKRQEEVRNAGMIWSVVESLPVHEAVKTQAKGFETFIENYKTSLANLAACGIKIVTYNFMPVTDWSRTTLDYIMHDGSRSL